MAEEANEIRGGGNSFTCRLNQAKLISISNLTVQKGNSLLSPCSYTSIVNETTENSHFVCIFTYVVGISRN